MRSSRRGPAVALALAVSLPACPDATFAQSLLDRPDNVSTDWIGNTGTLYFNFVHRFSTSAPPERKVTNFPTFLVATGIASRGLVGFNYATNSAVAARYPNEYEFFGRYAPLQQEEGAPFDLGGQVDYNLAVKGVDAELSAARRDGPVRLVAVTRLIADTLDGDRRRFSFGGGGTLRLGRFVALAGDAATLTKRDPGEKVAWSAGLHVALPNTPHTLSLHVSNATTSTLQGLARGGGTKRYGFEFTIPVHVGRFFANPEPVTTPAEAAGVAAPAPVDTAATVSLSPAVRMTPAPSQPPSVAPSPAPTIDSTTVPTSTPRTAAVSAPSRPAATSTSRATPKVLVARMKGQSFIPEHIEITTGTTVQWKNLDALIHTVTAVDKSFNSGVIAADGSYSHQFTKPGTYAIYCMAHPFMKGTVVVK